MTNAASSVLGRPSASLPRWSTRWVRCSTAINMRDLGGLPTTGGLTQPGRLFRSGTAVELDADDAATIAGLIGTYVDLRTKEEVERSGRPQALIAEGVEWVSLPLPGIRRFVGPPSRLGRSARLAEAYLAILDQAPGSVGRVLRVLVEPRPGGICFGCTAGKDRTGVVTALVLLAAGASRQQVVSDYALTTRFFRDRPDAGVGLLRCPAPERVDAFRLVALPATMTMFLDALEARYGDARQCVAAVALDAGIGRCLAQTLVGHDGQED